MTGVNWGILSGGNDFGNSLMQGLQVGQQMRLQRDQREREKATDAAYRGMMSGDPNAINALAQVDPRTAYTMQQQQVARQQAEKDRQTRVDVASGAAPASALAGINWDDFAAMSKQQADIAKQNLDTVGQLALMADTPQEWDDTIRELGPEFQQYLGRFDLRESVIARAGQAKAFLEQQAPKYMAVPNDADLVNVKDPAALSAFSAGRQAPQVSDVPPEAAAELRANPGTAAQFDEIFGAGAAQQILGGGGGNAPVNFPG